MTTTRIKRRVPPADAMFLYGESPETKMHVAGLMYFSPPAGAGPEFVQNLHAELQAAPIEAPWNLKLTTPRWLKNPLPYWVSDDSFDIDYHVRRSALASPGNERELGVLVSRLHSNSIDFTRPPWEMHLIEGLSGGRFAVYVKIHHALVDGYSGVQMLQRSLSRTPEDRSAPLFFSVGPRRRERAEVDRPGLLDSVVATAVGTARLASGTARSTVSVSRAITNLQLSRYSKHSALVRSLTAPTSILNQRTGRNRRFATAQLDMGRLKAVAGAGGGTLNDVVMTVFGGGLRTYLDELGELPGKSLVGFLPVNIRPEGDGGGGNQVGATLASMGTDIADPLERLAAIVASTTEAKAQMAGMSQGAMLAYSGYLLAPAALQTMGAVAGLSALTPTTFNLCVSNLPGPKQTMWFRGARLEAYYPVSIPTHGMALNITCLSYDGTMNVGFIGCRDALPHLQRLALHTGTALTELEDSLGLAQQ